MSASKEYRREYREKNKEKLNENLRRHRLKKKSELDMSVFFNHRKPWKCSEIEYIKEWYGKISAIDLSYELGRTPETIRTQYFKIMNEVV